MIKKPIEEVDPGDESAVNIRIHSDDPDIQYRIRIDKNTALTSKQINRLKDVGVNYVFIRDKDLEDLDPYVFDEELDAVQEEVTLELKNIQNHIESDSDADISVKKLTQTVENLVDAIKNTEVMLAFTTLKSHNDYTAKHSLDVTKLCVMLCLKYGEELHDKLRNETAADSNYTQKYMMKDLSLGALLHDLGKWTIPNEILNKPGKLDEQEWSAMQNHPVTGNKIIKNQQENIRAPVRTPAHQHHEQYGGGGYPRGLKKEQIHLYGRLTAVCDVYSALTSDRPYRIQKTPNRAREVMQSMQEEHTHFDPELLDIFMQTIPPFPNGQQVVLSNGTKGVVSEQGNLQDQPVVRVLYEGNERLDEPYEIQANTETSPEIIN